LWTARSRRQPWRFKISFDDGFIFSCSRNLHVSIALLQPYIKSWKHARKRLKNMDWIHRVTGACQNMVCLCGQRPMSCCSQTIHCAGAQGWYYFEGLLRFSGCVGFKDSRVLGSKGLLLIALSRICICFC